MSDRTNEESNAVKAAVHYMENARRDWNKSTDGSEFATFMAIDLCFQINELRAQLRESQAECAMLRKENFADDFNQACEQKSKWQQEAFIARKELKRARELLEKHACVLAPGRDCEICAFLATVKP